MTLMMVARICLVLCVLVVNSRATVITLTDVQTAEVVDAHNHYRRLEGSADMIEMKWSQELAEMAQEIADQCTGNHAQAVRDPMPFSSIGQNIASTGLAIDTNMTDVTWRWFREKQYYEYDTDTCAADEQCGHYTQVVWADTTHVGCGLAEDCTGTPFPNYMYCNYGPAGNYQGRIPYKKGTGCSQCNSGKGWCDNGLCKNECTSSGADCSCPLECSNGGTFRSDTCSCDCSPGWARTDCSAVCQNYNDQCGANPGWPESWCNKLHVGIDCLPMCGLCECTGQCNNGGTLNSANCRCDCDGSWTGADCSECNQQCQNGGNLNSATCSCDCAAGWAGSDCSVECKNYHPYCGAIPGWPKSWCDKSYVKSSCFSFCDLCECGGQCANGGTVNSDTCNCDCTNGWSGSDCSECNLQCQNGGTFDSGTCSCSCAAGWALTDCATECKNYNDSCGGNPGWPVSWCHKSYVKEACLLMCGLC